MPTIPQLHALKQAGRKIVGLVVSGERFAGMAELAGADIVSLGELPRIELRGQLPAEVGLDELLVVCAAARRAVKSALFNVELPAHEQNVEAALRLKACGADMVKLIGSAELVRTLVRAGVAVFAEFSGGRDEAPMLVDHAKRLEDAGASLLDFRNSGPLAGEAVARAVKIPVLGGPGGGPWLDGCYANVAQIGADALDAYAAEVRAGRQAAVR